MGARAAALRSTNDIGSMLASSSKPEREGGGGEGGREREREGESRGCE